MITDRGELVALLDSIAANPAVEAGCLYSRLENCFNSELRRDCFDSNEWAQLRQLVRLVGRYGSVGDSLDTPPFTKLEDQIRSSAVQLLTVLRGS